MELYPYEKEHLSRLRDSLAECMVLLKKNGAFPLSMPSTLAAYGSGVRRSVKGGTGSGEVNSRFAVSIEQGLEEAGFMLTSKAWLDAYDEIRSRAKEAFRNALKKEARAAGTNVYMYGMGAVMPEPDYKLPLLHCADAAIYVLSRISGEGSDRKAVPGDVLLTETEIRDILALNSMYERFMLVLNVGGPVDLSPVAEVGNILLLSQLGTEMGSALADVLLGRRNPSGKLTTTWTAWEDYCPDIDMGDNEETFYYEGVYVGYRYFSTVGKKPLFPFGFGLSYTEFSAQACGTALSGSVVTQKVKVKNLGMLKGREVVQLYLSAPERKLKKPLKELAGFAKTKELFSGEEEILELCFDLSDHASFDGEDNVYLLEAGEYTLFVGTDSESAAPTAVLSLEKDVVLKKVRPVAAKAEFREKEYARVSVPTSEDLPRLTIDAGAFALEETLYDPDVVIEPVIAALSDEELAALSVGAYPEKLSLSSVIGNAARHVAGAAGETT